MGLLESPKIQRSLEAKQEWKESKDSPNKHKVLIGDHKSRGHKALLQVHHSGNNNTCTTLFGQCLPGCYMNKTLSKTHRKNESYLHKWHCGSERAVFPKLTHLLKSHGAHIRSESGYSRSVLWKSQCIYIGACHAKPKFSERWAVLCRLLHFSTLVCHQNPSSQRKTLFYSFLKSGNF